MKLITAPEPYVYGLTQADIFLAGAIDMGNAVDWQAYVTEKLAQEDVTIVNPRRAKFDESTLDEQINWELFALERVDYIFMWFPKDSKAPISFFEAGMYLKSGKLIIGAEQGFYRRRNLEITTSRYFVSLHDSIQSMLAMLFRMM